MYCGHFGLHRPPFNNTPDPSFYFGTTEHEEALATLEYATVERKGFVLLTGEVGAGKTLVGRMFLRRIESRARTAVITHTQLSGRQLMAALCSEFELSVPSDASNLQLAERLQAFLLEQYAQDRLVVVLLDEAQNLPDESFEAVRMLGNLEADDAKLIQFCVLGQPELRTRFEQPGMRQLNQRLFRRFHLEALTSAQTAEYIRHRLRTAGWMGGELFTEAAVERIFQETKGTPRLINRMCDNALLTAYGRGAKLVDADIVEELAVSQLEAAPADTRSRQRPWLDEQSGAASGARSERRTTQIGGTAMLDFDATTMNLDPSIPETGERVGSRDEEIRGTIRPWLDADRSLADYRQRTQSTVDEMAIRCDDMQVHIDALRDRVVDTERETRTLVQKSAEALAGLNSQIKELESRCSSAAEIERVRAECGSNLTETLRRIDAQAESLEALQQAFAAMLAAADGPRQAGLAEGARRLETQVTALRRLEEEVAKREAGLQSRIETLAGQIARSGGKVDELRNQITAQKGEFESLVTTVAGRLESLSREVAGLQQLAATRQDLEEARSEHSAALQQLRGEHELAISDLQTGLARHENTVQDLGRQVRAQVSAIDEAVSSLRAESASQSDVASLRAQQATALANVDRQLAEEAEALAGMRQDLEARLGALGGDPEGRKDELKRRMTAHGRRLRDLRLRLSRMRAAIDGRLDGLDRQVRGLCDHAATRQELENVRSTQAAAIEQLEGEHAKAVAGIQNDLAQHENVVLDLGRQVRARMTAIEAAVSSLRDTSATAKEFEDLRTEQSAALAEMARRISEESDALAKLQDAVSHVVAAAPADQEAARAELSRQMLAQARRVRDLRNRLARMRAAIEGRMDGLGRELAALRAEMATRKDLERAQAQQSASIDGLKDEHARAVADIHTDLAHHEHAFQDLNRRIRDRMAAIENGVHALKSTSASRQEVEELRARQAEALTGVDRRLAEEAEALTLLQQTLNEQAGALAGDQQGTKEELTRRMLVHARRVRDMRNRLSRLQAATAGQLDEWQQELSGLREEMATRHDLEVIQARHLAELADLKGEHARAVADLRDGLAEREGAVEDLGQQISERMSGFERALDALRAASLSELDLENLRAEHAEALAGIDQRLTRESEALVGLREVLEARVGTVGDAQEAVREDVLRRMFTQVRRVRQLRNRLGQARVAIEGRLENLSQELAEIRLDMTSREEFEEARTELTTALTQLQQAHAQAVTELRNDLARHETTVADLSREVGARVSGLEQAVGELRAASASTEAFENLRTEQETALAEVKERLAGEIDALADLRKALDERAEGLTADQLSMREELQRRMLAQARHVHEVRDRLGRLQAMLSGRMEEWDRDLAALRQEMATRTDLAAAESRQVAALESVKDENARAIAGVQGGLVRQEEAVTDLNHRMQDGLNTLARADAEQTAALAGVRQEQARAVAGVQDGLTRQEVVVQDLDHRMQAGLTALTQADAEQAAALAGVREEQARTVEAIQSELAQHEGLVADLSRQIQERMAGFEAGLGQLENHAASNRDIENLRAEQAIVAAEMARRLALESEALSGLKRELEARAGSLTQEQQAAREKLEGRILKHARWIRDLRQRMANVQAALETRLDALTGDVRTGERLLAELSGRVGDHEAEMRSLDQRMASRLAQTQNALETCRNESAARVELEALRTDHAGIIEDLDRRLAADAEQLRQFQASVEEQSTSAQREQQAGLAALAERIGLQAGRVRRLHRRLRDGQQLLDARLEEMNERFAVRTDLEALREETRDEATQLRERLKLQRQATESLISGVVQRCRAVQDQIDALASAKAEMGDLTALSERQEQATADLLAQLERERENVGSRFEEVFAQWQRTDGELARLASSAAPADELDALRQRQERDTQQTLEALAVQRTDLEGLLAEVRQRCDEFSTRLAVLPDDFEAVRREHTEQMRSVCARMDSGRLQMETALREVTERCRQAQEQIEQLAARVASAEDVAAVRETHARDFSAVLSRLDRTDNDHQQELSNLNRRWDQLAQGVCSVAATAAPASSFTALEETLHENLNEVRSQLDSTSARHKEDLRSMVWSLQQIEARVAAVEAADRPAPVKIELNPEASRNLAAMTETARGEREALAQLAERAATLQNELNGTIGRLDSSFEQWRAGAAGVDQKAGELRASVRAAGELLRTMQRAQQVLDSKLNSHRWQQELSRGEALAGRIERAVGEATNVCGQLQAVLRDVDGCRDEADAWTARCSEVRELAGGLTKLLKAGRRAGANLETELDNRKRMLAAITRHTAGLAEVIDSARHIEQPTSARRFRPEPAAEEPTVSRIDWPDVLQTAERLAASTTAH